MFEINLNIGYLRKALRNNLFLIIFILLSVISIFYYLYFLNNGLALAYNDARSHLDIGRRVVEGLKPGFAQLGSVWLPLNHLLMVPTVWNDFMWHSGLAGALQSMIAFIATGLLIYKYLEKLHVGILGRLVGVAVFVANINVLYLQSTAMTELLLLATMTAGCYYLTVWHGNDNILDLIKAAFFIMASTLVRYDGWFLLLIAAGLVVLHNFRKNGYKAAEGMGLLFVTLGGFGIILWLLWNQLIFKDMLYFALGPYSAHAQQAQLASAGVLVTKSNWLLSAKIYIYSLLYNTYTFPAILGLVGAVLMWFDKKLPSSVRFSTLALLSPLLFNILALYLGFSVLFVQGLSGNTWFNVRYGMMLIPTIAIFTGFLIDKVKPLRLTLIGMLLFVLFFAFANGDAVTIDDARVGSSQKNVSEVAGWLKTNAAGQKGFILISAASHDAIIFSSGLPMSKFIHEGTGLYWESATSVPDRWARWIIMRTYDDSDQTWKLVSRTPGFSKFTKVGSYPFADIYELKPEYLGQLHTDPVFTKQK
jgi:hypothetical protein